VRGRRPGLGILNPSTDSTLRCGLEDFGIFKPACWLQASNQGAFPLPPPIAAPPAPSGAALTMAPASGEAAQSTIDALITQGVTASQAQQSQFFQNVNPAPGLLDNLAAAANDPNTTLLWWAFGIGAVIVGFSLLRK
jgi:hypothetical protein